MQAFGHRLSLVKRDRTPIIGHLLAPVIAFFLALGVGAIVLMIIGFAPLSVYSNFLFTSLAGGYQQAELFVKASPLILMALGLSFAYRANVWNIGAEGQFILGAIIGGAVALMVQESVGPGPLLWVLLIAAGTLGGMAWAAVPALLRTRFNASELLVSLMLVYVADHLLHFLVQGPMRDPMAFSWPKSADFADGATLPLLIEGTRLHIGTLLIPVLAVAAWFILTRTALGYRVRVQGSAPMAGRFSGFREPITVWQTLLISGGMAGLAGSIEAANTVGHLSEHVAADFGFQAILVAFLGRLNPIGIVLAGLVLAYIALGSETVQTFNQVPQGIALMLQATLVFFMLAADFVMSRRLEIEPLAPGRAPGQAAGQAPSQAPGEGVPAP